MSKIATVIGLFVALIVLFIGIFDFNSGRVITAFFNGQGLLVVIGGTLAAVLINYPLNQLGCLWHGMRKVFTAEPPELTELVEKVTQLSKVAHTRGQLSLEKEVELISDPFLRFAISEMLIYRDVDSLKSSLQNEIYNLQRRHSLCQEMFNNMASYAPAFGMMGTVMGLIMMMTQQAGGDQVIYGTQASKDMLGSLLQGMGLALVTTFYGVAFSNLVFQPIAGKLKALTDAEVLKDELILTGAVKIKQETPPMLVREALMTFLTEREKSVLAPNQ